MSALGDEIKAMIGKNGPISVERFVGLALGHPQHGYYMKQDPFGAAGDFTTAPEISQMFGELIGLWAAEVWASMGSPNPLRLIELGPGRGTLVSDALRAARVAPEFRAALDVWLVETSPMLAAIQHDTLLTCGAPIAWANALSETPDGPAIVLANEFLDALPIRQYVRSGREWRERQIGVDAAGELKFVLAQKPEPALRTPAAEGEMLEISASGHRLVYALASRLAKQGGAALFIDYGHETTGFSDTLQALRAHRPVDPLSEPGDCDITAHIDFDAMARSARAAGAAVYGPIDQGDFLKSIGLEERAQALIGRAREPSRAAGIEAARQRLAGKGEGEMGSLFKVMVIANRALPVPAGFQTPLSAAE